jgi:hypothetical protein
MPTNNHRFTTFLLLATLLCILPKPTVQATQKIDNSTAIAGASTLAKQISTQEWLGPLSAVALSPFFGLACLSGAATYGPEWLQNRSTLLGQASPLNNPLLFWVMLGLTIATSLPRFTKVSKPLALAAEKLEMYSVVIVMLAMRFLSNPSDAPEANAMMLETEPWLAAGIASMPLEVLLAIASAINIVVINTVKLAIEFLVWIIPIPAVDAVLEVTNKTLATGLMALYAYSPFLATLVNLAMFSFCAMVFLRLQRRIRSIKELLLMPILERMFSGQPTDKSRFKAFLKDRALGLPSNSMVFVERKEGQSLEVTHRGWLKTERWEGQLMETECSNGLLSDQLSVRVDGTCLFLSVRKGLLAPLAPLRGEELGVRGS